MVKKLYYKNGVFVIQTKNKPMDYCFFIVNNFPKKDYLLDYYKQKGLKYSSL